TTMTLVMDLIRTIRATRSEYKVPPGKPVSAAIAAGPETVKLKSEIDTIARLAHLQPVTLYDVMPHRPERSVSLLVGTTSVFLPLDEMTDVEAERQRLAGELEKAVKHLSSVCSKLDNPSFLDRAPGDVVQREKERAATIEDRIRRFQARLMALT
ncbi:MAG: hypothetical protein ACRDFS_04435, partial [Chloroflexota bacterium]